MIEYGKLKVSKSKNLEQSSKLGEQKARDISYDYVLYVPYV